MRIVGMLLLLIMASTGLFADEAALTRADTLAEPSATPALEIACKQELTGEPSNRVEALLPPSFFEPALESTCNCDTQCGGGCGRLRACYNGFPICECFHC